MRQVRFDDSGSSLLLDIDTDGWCRCYLTRPDGQTVYLGAESLAYLKRRLLAAFDADEHEFNGQIAGRPVEWLLSLDEVHSSLYCAIQESAWLLIWQAPDTHITGTITLPATARQAWRGKLEMLQA